MYVFSLITGFFFTFSNTTPTITIFVSLLFDKAVSMVKHIMEIVKWNTGFIKAVQTTRTWRVSLNIWGPFFCTLLAKLGPWGWLIMMRLVWKTATRFIIALFGTGTFRNAQGRYSLREHGRRCPSFAWSTILRHTQTAAVTSSRKPGWGLVCHAAGSFTYQRQVSANDSKSYGRTQSALNDHHINITWYVHRLSQLSLFLNSWEMHTWLPIHVEIPAEHPVVYANYACPNFFIIVN